MTVPSVAVEDFGVETVAGDHSEPVVARRRNLRLAGAAPVLRLPRLCSWSGRRSRSSPRRFDSESGVSTSAFTEAITGQYQRAFVASLKLSLVTALLGAVIGVLLAYAAATLRRPKWLRSRRSPPSAGWPPTSAASRWPSRSSPHLGTQGLMTKILKSGGLDLQDQGFTIYSFWGLVIVYLYFQIPLMVLVTFPAIDGLKPAWREAASNLGATLWGYWRRVGHPRPGPVDPRWHPAAVRQRVQRLRHRLRADGRQLEPGDRSRSGSSCRATPSPGRGSSATRWRRG